MATHAHSRSPNAHAPWAEIVPGADPMTVAEYERLPEDGWQYELVEGVLVRMPLSGGQASNIATRLSARLGVFVEANALGQLTGADGGYTFSALGQADTELGPDVALVRSDKVPERGTPAYTRAWAVAHDLAVEVASPSQRRPETAAKVRRYLAAGATLVWVVWPRWEQVDVWHPRRRLPRATRWTTRTWCKGSATRSRGCSASPSPRRGRIYDLHGNRVRSRGPDLERSWQAPHPKGSRRRDVAP